MSKFRRIVSTRGSLAYGSGARHAGFGELKGAAAQFIPGQAVPIPPPVVEYLTDET